MQLREFFEQFSRAVVQILRDHDLQDRVQVAGFVRLTVDDAFAAKPEPCSAGRSRRNSHRDQAFAERWHVNFRTERRFGQRDRHVDQQVGAVASEIGVRSDSDLDHQVAVGPSAHAGMPLSRQPDDAATVDSGWNSSGNLLRLPRGVDGQAVAAAFRRRGKRDVDRCLDVLPLSRASSPPTTATPEEIAKVETAAPSSAKQIAQINLPAAEGRRSAASPTALKSRMTESVVLLPFLRVAQDRIRFLDLLELLSRRLVVGFAVGVIFARKLSISLLEFGLGRIPRNTQHLMKVFSD